MGVLARPEALDACGVKKLSSIASKRVLGIPAILPVVAVAGVLAARLAGFLG